MKNIFFQHVLFTFIAKVYFKPLVRIVVKSVIFNVHVFEHIYRLMTLTLSYADERCWTYRWLSPFNTISNYLQTETAFKFCITVFPLALRQH